MNKSAENSIIVKQMELGPMQNFVYLIGCPRAKEAAVVDPAWDVPAILAAAQKEGMVIRHILLTHHHFDHINGVEELSARTGAVVVANKNEIPLLAFSKKCQVRAVEDKDTLQIGDGTVKFLHTPGHTPGSQCIVVQNRLISGDTLFIGACGRTDLPGGSPEALYQSLHGCIRNLDDGLILMPGHHYGRETAVPLGAQKKRNPFLMCDSPEEFLNMVG